MVSDDEHVDRLELARALVAAGCAVLVTADRLDVIRRDLWGAGGSRDTPRCSRPPPGGSRGSDFLSPSRITEE